MSTKTVEETQRAIRDNLKWLEIMEEGAAWRFVYELNAEFIRADQKPISMETSHIFIDAKNNGKS